MANPERGEVALTVNGREYTLRLSMNVAATFEAKHKRRIGDLFANAAAMSFLDIRALIWLLLQKHHGDDFKTLEQVGELIDDAGGVATFFETIQALQEANALETPSEGASGNPPTAQSGAGGTST